LALPAQPWIGLYREGILNWALRGKDDSDFLGVWAELVVTLLPFTERPRKTRRLDFLSEVEIEIRATRFIFRSDPGHPMGKGFIGFQV
jgi:hypothetical protein